MYQTLFKVYSQMAYWEKHRTSDLVGAGGSYTQWASWHIVNWEENSLLKVHANYWVSIDSHMTISVISLHSTHLIKLLSILCRDAVPWVRCIYHNWNLILRKYCLPFSPPQMVPYTNQCRLLQIKRRLTLILGMRRFSTSPPCSGSSHPHHG